MQNYLKRVVIISIIVFLTICGFSIYSRYFSKPTDQNTDWAKEQLQQKREQSSNTYDIIVFGGDPEGVSAAVSSARLGAKVLLLSYEDGLGGLMTYGWLNSIDMNYNPAGKIITRGIFLEFYEKLGGDSFDVDKAKKIFHEMVQKEENIEYIPSVKLIDVIIEGNTLKGIKINKDGKETTVYGKRIIDASQDGDIMAKANVPYTYGQEDLGVTNTKMAVTLCFKVNGVDWEALKTDIKKRGNSGDGINEHSAWGFGDIYTSYKAIHSNMRLRGLNIGRQEDGSVLLNALQIFDVDALKQEERQKAEKEGAIEAENIVVFLKGFLPSFKNASFGGVAPELYVRETRHIKGEYTLTVLDVLENRDFWDKIALGSYPLDVQATSSSNTGYVMGNPANYSIPLRAIVPVNLENAYIVGRSASFESLAASSSRVIPVGMCTGEAASIASVYSIINDITPREILGNKKMVEDIQKLILEQGGYLTVTEVKNPYEDIWAYKDARKLIKLGLIVKGYTNEIPFNKTCSTDELCNLLLNGYKRLSFELTEEQRAFIAQYYGGGELKSDHIARIAMYLLKGTNVEKELAWETAIKEGVISEETKSKTEKGQVVTKDIVYNMAVYMIEQLMGKEMPT